MIASLCPIIPFKGTMLTTDLDGTLLIHANNHKVTDVEKRLYQTDSIQKAEAAVKRNGIDTVLLNTGRDFTELSEVKDILERTTMPVGAISLQDGKRLLTKPKNLTPNQWIRTLFNKNINYLAFKDEKWADLNEAPLKEIANFLTKEKGFIHRKDNGEKLIYSKPVEKGDVGVKKASKDALWMVTIVPPGINFELSVRDSKPEDEIDLEAFNKQLSSEIQEMLKQKGFDIEELKTKKQVSYSNSIERNDVSKGKVADYFRNNSSDIDFEIRAGNADNDISMLKTNNPNIQAIQVGDDEVLRNLLAPYSNVTYVPTGELGQGIDEACKKINLIA